MIRECSYCKEKFGCKDEKNNAQCKDCSKVKCTTTQNEEITHGICPKCLPDARKELLLHKKTPKFSVVGNIKFLNHKTKITKPF